MASCSAARSPSAANRPSYAAMEEEPRGREVALVVVHEPSEAGSILEPALDDFDGEPPDGVADSIDVVSPASAPTAEVVAAGGGPCMQEAAYLRPRLNNKLYRNEGIVLNCDFVK